MKICWWLLAICTLASAVSLLPMDSNAAGVARAGETIVKVEHFDKDPLWDGWQNRIKPREGKPVEQEFGFRATNFAGKQQGEIGGTIWRDSKVAWYADKIPAKTLNEKLHASGTFALTATSGSSGAFFGWFK